MREVMLMVHLEKTPSSSTIFIVDRFSGSVPPLTGVTRKRAMQDSTSLFVHWSSCGPVATTDTYSSPSKELHSLLSDQRAAVATVKLFRTPIDIVKLVKIGSPSLKHQVCYNFSRAMVGMFEWLSRSEGHVHVVNGLQEDLTRARQEIDSLRGQISSLDR
ncbi:hypothetical protein F0562_032508 [Nyssa sinensis]|uniref:Uncharacterized protein n=1 Tax=Nyssa sinensis TaxID=561372 RepID=A0A5J5AMX8_9ASTE|nr:hypothetical protein F0562_032508 [Nyssa sinensis]